MKSLFLARSLPVVAGVVLFSGAGASAQDANALYTRALAATCANCHGTSGRRPTSPRRCRRSRRASAPPP